jgi:hypothetical protein
VYYDQKIRVVCEFKLKVITTSVLILSLLVPNALSKEIKSPSKQVVFSKWLGFVKTCSEVYKVDPYFALAVAETESSCKGERFRFGKMGKGTYYGPFGIHKQFLKKWPIDDPYVNTEIGIRALSRYKNQRAALKKYNATFNESYWKRIKSLERKYQDSKVFQNMNIVSTK